MSVKLKYKPIYVQYHNFDKVGYYPHEDAFVNDDILAFNEGRVWTQKEAFESRGHYVYVILGLKQKGHKGKDYFLFDRTLIKTFERPREGFGFDLVGPTTFCKVPIRLNDLDGFKNFSRKTMGNFAFGFQNITNDPFKDIIKNEENFFTMEEMTEVSPKEWLYNFEEQFIEDESIKLFELL